MGIKWYIFLLNYVINKFKMIRLLEKEYKFFSLFNFFLNLYICELDNELCRLLYRKFGLSCVIFK